MKTYLDPEDVELMEEAATCPRDRVLIRLLFRLGCRISEALALKIVDIDFDRHTVTIDHLKRRTRLTCPQCRARLAKSHVFCPKCGVGVEKMVAREEEHHRVRTLPLDSNTLNLLRDYIAEGGSGAQDDNMLVFSINRHRAWHVVRECATRAGLPALVNPETGKARGVSPHRLRDAFAVHAVKTR